MSRRNDHTVYKLLTSAQIDFQEVKHEPMHTVAESQKVLPGLFPVKNLLLQEEKGERFVLVVMSGKYKLNTKKLSVQIGYKKLRFSTAEVLYEKLHVTPGSVSLFSILGMKMTNIRLVIDSTLRAEQSLGFHPNDNTRTIFISANNIELLLDKESIAFEWLDLL